ncbi:MAG: MATE family efflux transporter [Clostridiales bacterium]|nr:MATE family efflux transporter [Clostridiales bacterium]
METTKANPLGYQSIGKLILRFSTPAILSNIVNAIYNIVDQVFIGHGIGTAGIAATNVAFPLNTLTNALSYMIASGAATKFNLSLGAGLQEDAEKAAGTGLTMSVVTGAALSLISILFLSPLLRAFGASADIMGLATDYTFIIALGIPFQIFTVVACQLIRADGNPNWTMFVLMSGSVFNLIFDPVFMFVFGWGIKGIAWATTMGQMLTAALALAYLLRGMRTATITRRILVPVLSSVRTICTLGMAGFFNMIAMTIMQIVLNNTLRFYGDLSYYGSTVTLGAVGAISKINYIYSSCCYGFGQGCQPIYGFNYGAKNYARVRKTLVTAMICITTISVLFFTLFQTLPRPIISIFGQGTAEYYEFATKYLRIFMFMTFANGLQPLTGGFFTATGRAKIGMFVTLTRQLIFLIPLLLILPLFYGIEGVLYAGPIADFAAAAIAIVLISREMQRLGRIIAAAET